MIRWIPLAVIWTSLLQPEGAPQRAPQKPAGQQPAINAAAQPAAAQPFNPPSASQPSPAAAATMSPEKIRAAIAALGSPDWSARQHATDDLIVAGEQAYPAMKAEFRRTSSYEVKRRIRFVAEQCEFFKAVDSRGGFLGIGPQPTDSRGNPAIPAGHLWIRITKVLDDTGADRAGLRMNDYITSINGEPIKADGKMEFSAWIRQQAPGTQVKFGVRRGETDMVVDATLGRRRLDQADLFTYPMAPRVQEARTKFGLWWRKEFDPAGTADESAPLNANPDWSLEPARGARP